MCFYYTILALIWGLNNYNLISGLGNTSSVLKSLFTPLISFVKVLFLVSKKLKANQFVGIVNNPIQIAIDEIGHSHYYSYFEHNTGATAYSSPLFEMRPI